MNKEKRKRKKKFLGPKRFVRLSESIAKSLNPVQQFLMLPGIQSVVLSPITQNFIGCRIGIDVTAENPWVLVDRNKILDNLDLHEQSSEFIAIQESLELYPEPQILVGSYGFQQETDEEFLVCTTTNTKDDVMYVLDVARALIVEKIINSLAIEANFWNSLGSEIEVSSERIFVLRPLLIIEIETVFPIFNEPRKFGLRLAEQAKDGYVELRSGHFSYVLKSRCDSSVQTVLQKIDAVSQTIALAPNNKAIQYKYEYDDITLSIKATESLLKFMYQKLDGLSELLNVNYHIQLYKNDYEELPNKYKYKKLLSPIELLSFQDVLSVKNKKISSLSWNCLISGILAAAYCTIPSSRREYLQNYNNPNDTIFEKHFVLLWCYTDVVQPKLYLHANRDVISINFCPYDENILVGGYDNGQIVIWDITNKLQESEKLEVLTSQEEKHRLILKPYMQWMKDPPDNKQVFPALISYPDISHNCAVSDIQWLRQDCYITRNGKYEACNENEEHMQFLTSSLGDGTILIWDLKKNQKKDSVKRSKKRLQRISRMPSAIHMDVSPLKHLQFDFVPQYKLIINQPNGNKIHSTNLIIKNQNFEYKVRSQTTVCDSEKRTYYDSVPSEEEIDFTQSFLISSGLGFIYTCNWEGYDYDQSQQINADICSIKSFSSIHDGPIKVCRLNKFYPTILLTVGGTIFAVWDMSESKGPIFWRKSKIGYVSGIWSIPHPLGIILARQDANLEFWNLLERTEIPVRIIKNKGNPLTFLYCDSRMLNTKIRSLVTTDIYGAIKVFVLPTTIFDIPPNVEKVSKTFLDQIKMRKDNMNFWSMNVASQMKRMSQLNEPTDEEVEGQTELGVKNDTSTQENGETSVPTKSNDTKTEAPKPTHIAIHNTPATIWKKKEENRMFKVLLKKHKLNLEDLKQDKKILDKSIRDKEGKDRKVQLILSNKDAIFKEKCDVSLLGERYSFHRKQSTKDMPREVIETMKSGYIEAYNDMESVKLKEIENTHYHVKRYWSKWK